MPKLTGLFKFTGTMGDVTAYKQNGETIVRTKGGVEKSRIDNDPAFQRTRENNSEFGNAAKDAKKLRGSLSAQIGKVKDRLMTSRFTKLIRSLVNEDTSSPRGQRRLPAAAIPQLEGFNFNDRARMDDVLRVQLPVSVDTTADEATVSIPAFNPLVDMAAPQGATHFKITAAAGIFDLDPGDNVTANVSASTAELPVGTQVTAQTLTLANTNTIVNFSDAYMVTLLVEFFQEVNGVFYPLNNGSYNPMKVIKSA